MSTTTDPYTKQRSEALEHANDIRLARADLKRRIASGEVFAASVILDPPPEAKTWAVGELVTTQRRWGPQRMRNLLSRLMLPETKRLGLLTERQRHQLARALAPSESEDA